MSRIRTTRAPSPSSHLCRALVPMLFVYAMGCSDADAAPSPRTEAPEATSAAPAEMHAEAAPARAATTASAVVASATEAEPAGAATTGRPAGPAPALDSVRWAPDPREPEESLESLDALARAHFHGPARVAGRLRARHLRERLSLALVVTVDASLDDEEHDVDAMIGFGRLRATETPPPAPGLERRPLGNERDDTCRCDGEDVVQFHLMRVVHGPTPVVASVELARGCSGLDFDARLLDFDGDARVELRLELGYTGWESCGVNTKETAYTGPS